jgi:hypothetical protein
MYSVPSSFYLGAEMPYFHVRITTSDTKDFVVNAANRFEAEDAAAKAADGQKIDSKTIIQTNESSNDSVDVVTAEKADWTNALKKTKVK